MCGQTLVPRSRAANALSPSVLWNKARAFSFRHSRALRSTGRIWLVRVSLRVPLLLPSPSIYQRDVKSQPDSAPVFRSIHSCSLRSEGTKKKITGRVTTNQHLECSTRGIKLKAQLLINMFVSVFKSSKQLHNHPVTWICVWNQKHKNESKHIFPSNRFFLKVVVKLFSSDVERMNLFHLKYSLKHGAQVFSELICFCTDDPWIQGNIYSTFLLRSNYKLHYIDLSCLMKENYHSREIFLTLNWLISHLPSGSPSANSRSSV